MSRHDETSELLFKTACELCREVGDDTRGDNLGVFSDGHGYCFAKHGYVKPQTVKEWLGEEVGDGSGGGGGGRTSGFGAVDGSFMKARVSAGKGDLLDDVRAFDSGLAHRNLDLATLKIWDYGYGYLADGTVVQVAPYRNRERAIVAQKMRRADKTMPWAGNDRQAVPLWGWHLWSPGRKLVVTEGEIDAMSVSRVWGHKWAVVSVAHGAKGALKDLKAAYWFLEGFEEVILLFDEDDEGRAAIEECCLGLTGAPFALKVGRLKPYKDANEALVARDYEAIKNAVFGASPYRPQEIVDIGDIVEEALERKAEKGEPYPWGGLNLLTGGAFKDTIVTVFSSSGGGKSTICRHWLLHFHEHTDAVCGGIFLEEKAAKTLLDFVSIKRGVNLRTNRDGITDEEVRETVAELRRDKPLYLYNQSFSLFDPEKLLQQIRYMAVGLGCRYICLDHLSYVVGGMDTGDERKAIDLLMSRLRALVTDTGITLFLVVHLRRNDSDKSLDQGGRISKNHIRGSQSIEQISDFLIAAQRDKTKEELRDYVEVIVMKNRETGDERTACWLHYDRQTGRLSEVPFPGETAEGPAPAKMPAVVSDTEEEAQQPPF